MELETFETKRLILKKLTPKDFTHLFDNCPDSEIKSLLGLTTDEELYKEKEKSRVGYTTYDRTIVAFVIVLKTNSETIGRCGFHNWYPDHKKAEIGYALHRDENKQKGYMTEAVAALLEYGFKTMHLNRIEACIGPSNIASLGLVKKYGFTQEGHLRQHYILNDGVQDSLIFSLLRQEYGA